MSTTQASSERSTAFRAILETDTLTDFLDVQRVFCNEAKWHIEDGGIRVRAVDPANVALAETVLDASAFESYTPTDGLLGINLQKLDDYATSKAAGDLIQLAIDVETQRLTVDVGPTQYEMALIDPASIRKEPEPPSLDLPAEIGLDGATFANAIDAAELVSDHVVLSVDPDAKTFVVRSEGDIDAATTVLGEDELLTANTGPDPAESIYSLDYLSDMVKPVPPDGAVRLRVGDEHPLQMQYALADEGIDVTQTLAPRIQKR